MKNLSFLLMSLLFVLAVNVGYVAAVPDIRGDYSGSYETHVANCSNPNDNGIYQASLAMTIQSQTGSAFSGSATGNFDVNGSTLNEVIQLSGTITESGQISGTTTHTFLDTYGEGTFTGQLSGNTLTMENSGRDTSPGHTCTYVRYMTAIRKPSRTEIVPSDHNILDGFGWSVSISGNHAIVGADNDDHLGVKSGSAYIFERNGSSWTQVTKLSGSDTDAGDSFGESVSISGDYAIVGAFHGNSNGVNSGSAYIFERNGSSWNQMQKLTAGDGEVNDFFGTSVSISGEYAIVGASNDKWGGSAYIFERSGNSWSQAKKLTTGNATRFAAFGISVALSGEFAIVGAPSDDPNPSGFWSNGSAFIFQKNGNSWDEVDKLTSSDVDAYHSFGTSVSISGDYAIVGGTPNYTDETASRSAYIFKRNGSGWDQVAKLSGGAYFGGSVSISGSYALVGAPYEGAFLYQRSGDAWNQVAKLTDSDEFVHPAFGLRVSISGSYALVGTPGAAAYIFDLFIPGNNSGYIAMPWIPLLLFDD